ncbi:polysaccharide deacetylase family protein [Bacillus sp. AFS088145]|uniref:polysaccharide deacetylase family protein n=1 Tax=Bacillus sp. AFS088145 TaxID=2033514 RepID=UPI000BF4D601|nr:polysaccharide deacetylase family protein [Bacillus sp. AFS088145]PFH85604.1 polysaccharide deacetylase [Bacillus sp. AFS088145]
MIKKVYRKIRLKAAQTWYWHRFYAKLIKEMEKKIHSNNKLIKINSDVPFVSKPGIAFSFDDSFRVEQWHKYGMDLFGYYDVKVTFNINAFHHYEGKREHTQREIDLLLELQANGHELAHHGLKHENAKAYITEYNLSKWIEDEIEPLFKWMEKQAHSKTREKFKVPVSHAFPFAAYNDEMITALVSKYFKIVRGGNMSEEHLTPFNHTGFAPSICIDDTFLKSEKYIKKVLRVAKKTGLNLILMSHSILPEEVRWEDFGWGEESNFAGTWRTSPNMIEVIIKEARKLGFEFYTTAEIAGVATFIDPNLERCIRNQLINPNVKWITISELNSIKEIDLSGQNITNLDGIQYLSNLEKINLSNNQITDYRLLNRLSKLKEIYGDNDQISSKTGTQY